MHYAFITVVWQGGVQLSGFFKTNKMYRKAPLPRVHPSNYIGPVLAAAFLMMWPALYNRYPLLYPDSMAYLENGPLVARALFLQVFSDDYGQRSLIYCLGILPLHLNVTAWPIVALNALLTAYVIWHTMHSVLPKKTAIRYLALVLPQHSYWIELVGLMDYAGHSRPRTVSLHVYSCVCSAASLP